MIITVITGAFLPLRALPVNAATGLTWRNETAMANPVMLRAVFIERRMQPQVPFPLRAYTAAIITITPSRYAIELRDRDGKLKGRLENIATAVSWEWNRIGGCGKCQIRLDCDYSLYDIQPDDDIRIYLPNATTGATLWYRGYVEQTSPALQTGNKGQISIECIGYFGWLERIVAQESDAAITYANTEVSLIIQDLIDDFVVANSDITRGTIEAGIFTPDTIAFKTTIREALRTCIDLMGPVECGVDASLQFFLYRQITTIRHVLYLGDKITRLQDRKDFKNIVNKIHFEGGTTGGVVYKTNGQSLSSITRNGRREEIVSNGSITTPSVANRLISSIFTQRSAPIRQMSISLKNTQKRFEATLPIGSCSVVDPDINQTGAVYGTTANGGSNKKYGRVAAGGDGQVYGGVAKHQMERIQYTLSPEDGRVHAEVQFGSTISYSRASAEMKRLEQNLNAVRERSLT